MARKHKGIIAIGVIAVGVSILAAGVIGGIGKAIFGMAAGEDEAVAAPTAGGFNVTVGPEPEAEKQPPHETQPATKRATATARPKTPKKTLTEKWLDGVNGGGMYSWREESQQIAGVGGSAGGGCNILQPVQVYAMLAMNTTTDEPGLSIASVSEDIQGAMSDGYDCIAIPMGSVVSLTTGSAGEYAENRAPVTVDKIYLPDGMVVDVGQKATSLDGVPGPIGKANHHVVSKTVAAGTGALFQFVDNLSRIGSFSSGDVDSPIKDMVRKKLERPAEISLSKQSIAFTVFPTSTAGY